MSGQENREAGNIFKIRRKKKNKLDYFSVLLQTSTFRSLQFVCVHCYLFLTLPPPHTHSPFFFLLLYFSDSKWQCVLNLPWPQNPIHLPRVAVLHAWFMSGGYALSLDWARTVGGNGRARIPSSTPKTFVYLHTLLLNWLHNHPGSRQIKGWTEEITRPRQQDSSHPYNCCKFGCIILCHMKYSNAEMSVVHKRREQTIHTMWISYVA